MAATCSLCLEENKKPDKPVSIACQNCGSLACEDHLNWLDDKAYCDRCMTGVVARAGNTLQAGVAGLQRKSEASRLNELRLQIENDRRLRELLGLEDYDQAVLGRVDAILTLLLPYFENVKVSPR